MKEKQESIQASILDRLIDREPQLSRESVQYRLLNFGQVKAGVIRDLENLLNTKSQILPVPAAYKEVNDSVFVYGLVRLHLAKPQESLYKAAASPGHRENHFKI